MSSSKNNSNFWISYADLMTSLFFIMLVLFIVVVGKLVSNPPLEDCKKIKQENKELRQENKKLNAELKKIKGDKNATEEQLNKLVELFNVQEKISKDYFKYDTEHKRFTLKDFTSRFNTNSSDITDIPVNERTKLLKIGESLSKTFEKAKRDEETKDAQYLLIVEGQASKDGYVFNYELSYERALSLVKFWNRNDIKFPNNCEIIISGSGQSSNFRDWPDIPPANQRFVIHVIPKPGKLPPIKKH